MEKGFCVTGEKRKRIPEVAPQRQSTAKEAVPKEPSEDETSGDNAAAEATPNIQAEAPKKVMEEKPRSSNLDETFPEVCHFFQTSCHETVLCIESSATIQMVEKVSRPILCVGLFSIGYPDTDSVYEDEGEKSSARSVCRRYASLYSTADGHSMIQRKAGFLDCLLLFILYVKRHSKLSDQS